MSSLDRDVKKTLAYSAFFDHFLTPEEVHYWLISPRLVPIEQILSATPLPDPDPDAIKKKTKRRQFSREKISRAQKIASLLSLIPTIHLVAVTGSVAVGSANERDDIDLMIVTRDHSLWLTRPLVLLLLTLFSSRRLPGQSYESAAHSFCPNLWLEHRSLKVPPHKHNLYTAHEVLFVTPVFDRSHTHMSFLKSNHWVKRYLANAYSHATSNSHSDHSVSFLPLSLITLPFNLIFFLIQYLYMKPKITTEDVALDSAYFHTQDFHKKIKSHLGRVLR